MARLGRFGKLPFRLGGEPSPQAKAFGALRALESATLGPVDDYFGDQTIDGTWHQAMAAGLGALSTFGEAAVWQAWPDTVTDLIVEYERILNIAPPIGASDEARRKAITPQWLGDIHSDYPGMIAALREIDIRYTLEAPNHTLSASTMPGKVFDEQAGPNTFAGGRTASQYPNYSDDYNVTALLNVGAALAPLGNVGAQQAAGQQLLGNALPAWCDYRVVLTVGFTLDVSLLDCTGLT